MIIFWIAYAKSLVSLLYCEKIADLQMSILKIKDK